MKIAEATVDILYDALRDKWLRGELTDEQYNAAYDLLVKLQAMAVPGGRRG